MTLDYLVSIFKIILFDLVLSGDNAVVIGLAAHLLPPRQRRQAMIWGCGMAIVMRVLLTLVVAELLLFPGLRFVGAVLLVWIACKLIQEEAESADVTKPAPTTLPKAIMRIAMADFIMSLDNIVAIAGASDSDPVRIILGLLLSISMLLLLSAVIMEIMSRYRWIAYVGCGRARLDRGRHDGPRPGSAIQRRMGPVGLDSWPFPLGRAGSCGSASRSSA